jgi:hypothetical protein
MDDMRQELAALRQELNALRERETSRGWTMMRGVASALMAMAPFVLALLLWGSAVNEDRSVTKLEITVLKKADDRHEQALAEQRREVISRLDAIAQEVSTLSKQMAKIVK